MTRNRKTCAFIEGQSGQGISRFRTDRQAGTTTACILHGFAPWSTPVNTTTSQSVEDAERVWWNTSKQVEPTVQQKDKEAVVSNIWKHVLQVSVRLVVCGMNSSIQLLRFYFLRRPCGQKWREIVLFFYAVSEYRKRSGEYRRAVGEYRRRSWRTQERIRRIQERAAQNHLNTSITATRAIPTT